jgi:hypothetical protein
MTYRVREASRYRDRLNHWAVIRLLPNVQRLVVARFHKRSDAEGHAAALKRLVPNGIYIVIFDPIGEDDPK